MKCSNKNLDKLYTQLNEKNKIIDYSKIDVVVNGEGYIFPQNTEKIKKKQKVCGDIINIVLHLIIIITLISIIAMFIFQWRNPTANGMTFFTHFKDVMNFRTLEKFQGNINTNQ